MNLTKSIVDKLPSPESDKLGKTGQKRYYDNKLKGFGLRITSGGSRTFFVEKQVKNKLRRMSLGRYGELTVEEARKQAQKMMGQIAQGIDPVAEKRAAKMRVVTLEEVLTDYLRNRKSLKTKTAYDYKRVLNVAFSDWCSKPLTFITKDQVAKQHEKLGKMRGEAYANLAMRLLRALFNFAMSQYEDAQGCSIIIENPVKRLSQTRAWYRVERRQTYIKSHALSAWYQGVMMLENETFRDYLLFILLTGLRRQEAAQLQWEQVDLTAKTVTLTDTKNRQNFTFPLSDYLLRLLTERKLKTAGRYVFPGKDENCPIVEPRKQMARVTKISGVSFTIHDLRRTFITLAESLDISGYALKRLLNHKMNNDVTAGYIITDVERLRKPMQQVTDHFLHYFQKN
jgi:integrase